MSKHHVDCGRPEWLAFSLELNLYPAIVPIHDSGMPDGPVYLTGKDQDKSLWLDDEEVVAAVDAARWRGADTDDISADELIGRLDNWSPIAREWIAKALAEKRGEFAERLLELLKSDAIRH